MSQIQAKSINQESSTVALKLNNERFRLLNFHNWEFIQLDPQEETMKESQIPAEKTPTEKLFEFLYEVSNYKQPNENNKNGKNPFSIPRKKISQIICRFLRHRNRLPYPPGSDYNGRIRSIFQVILSIANDKIGLNKCKTYEKEIEELMTSNLNLETKTNKDIRSTMMSRIVMTIERLNKATTVLILIHVSLFQEEGDHFRITEVFIDDVLKFLANFWREIAQGNQELIRKEEFGQNLCDFLSFKTKFSYHEYLNRPYMLWSVACSMAKYWTDKTGRGLERRNLSHGKDYQKGTSELINKIIFYLNYQYILKDIGTKIVL
jgi:hypothetical protein